MELSNYGGSMIGTAGGQLEADAFDINEHKTKLIGKGMINLFNNSI
jgi:hypothetical protein